MRKKVEEILIKMGVYPNLLGFGYICKAIELINSSKERMKIVDRIYVDIAEEFNSSKSRVERNIRHAISKMDKNSEAYKQYIGIEDVSNSAVLYTLAINLRED